MGVAFLMGKGGSGEGTAIASDVLAPKTFTNDSDSGIVGTMPNRAGDTACLSSSVSGTTLKLLASDGYRDGVNDNVTITDADFLATNIKNGVNLFGLTGSYVGAIIPRVNSITYSGTYATASYFTQSGCDVFYSAGGKVGIVIQGGTTASYEHIYFTLVNNSGLGISMVQTNYTYSTSDVYGAVSGYYIAILTGVTANINVVCNFSGVNSSYDFVECDLTITLA